MDPWICLFPFIYHLYQLPIWVMSSEDGRPLVVTGGSAKIQDETTESSSQFFNVLGV